MPSASAELAASSATPAASAVRSEHAVPTVLATLPVSAYQARVALDEDAVYVLTEKVAHRYAAGEKPQELAIDSGLGAALTTRSIVYWSKGALWKLPKRGGKARRIGEVKHQPQYLVTSGYDLAWLDRSEAGQFTIQTLEGTKPRVVYASHGRVDAATMVSDWVFFAERTKDASWHIGRVQLTGATPTFAVERNGRTPSMLTSFQDHIYYYDGTVRSVLRLSPDFQREEILAKNFICSPIAVWERVYCGRVDGVFEVVPESDAPHRLTNNDTQLVASIGANANLVAWISEAGEAELTVKVLATEPR